MNISDLLLTTVVNYGAPALGAVVMLAAIGIPLPSTLLVIAAGAFVRMEFLDLPGAAAFVLFGAVLGDSIGYSIGRFAGEWAEGRLGAQPLWLSTKKSFQRYGGGMVFITRCLLTSAAIPVNVIAGGSRYAYPRFLIYDVAGEAAWLVGFGSLGYYFGSQWEAVSQAAMDFGGLIAGIVVLSAGIYLAVKKFW